MRGYGGVDVRTPALRVTTSTPPHSQTSTPPRNAHDSQLRRRIGRYAHARLVRGAHPLPADRRGAGVGPRSRRPRARRRGVCRSRRPLWRGDGLRRQLARFRQRAQPARARRPRLRHRASAAGRRHVSVVRRGERRARRACRADGRRGPRRRLRVRRQRRRSGSASAGDGSEVHGAHAGRGGRRIARARLRPLRLVHR